jgi:hypothetical protein
MEWAQGHNAEPSAIGRESLATAIGLFQDFLLPSACRAFGGVRRDKGEADASSLLKRMRLEGGRTVNARAIRRQWSLPGLSTPKAVNAALDILCQAGWVRQHREAKPGRPAGAWEVNPLLWEGAP